MRSLLTCGLVVLTFPFCLGAFSFLLAFLGMGVVPMNQRSAMNLLVLPDMVAVKGALSDSLQESISNISFLTEVYVVLAWIMAGGLALVVGFLLPRFQLGMFLIMGLMAVTRTIVLSVAFQLPIWMPIIGVIALGTLTFLMAFAASRVRIIDQDWLFQKLGRGKSSSDQGMSVSADVRKYQRLFSMWNWLFLLCFLGWIVYSSVD